MDWILILGAKSDIAKALARRFAKEKFNLYLAGRNIELLKEFSSDLKIRFQIDVHEVEWDALKTEQHQAIYESLSPKPSGVIAVAGYLGDQQRAQKDLQERSLITDTNYSGLISMLEWVAADFEEKKSGFIIGISSVSGDRGRQSNYLYGSAKAGLTCFLSGLRNRLYSSHVKVLTVKPGFVATSMTKDMDLNPRLTATPDKVAKDVFKAWRKNKCVLYTPWYWRWIMLVVRSIPEKIFRKLKL